MYHLAFAGPNPLLGKEELDKPAFDSVLWPRMMDGNAELMIVLRILFVPVNSLAVGPMCPDADGELNVIGNWKDDEWRDYKRRALELANNTWNNQLWLETPASYTELNYPTSKADIRPNVKCSLVVCEADSASEAHARVRVVKLTNRRVDSCTFRSNFTLWDSADLVVHNFSPAQLSREQVAHFSIPHEVGHLLGLHHIGETEKIGTCKMASSHWTSNDQYGNNAQAPAWVARNIMGLGTVVHTCDAKPWIDRMVRHTNGKTRASDWKAWSLKLDPKPLR